MKLPKHIEDFFEKEELPNEDVFDKLVESMNLETPLYEECMKTRKFLKREGQLRK